MRSLGSNHHDCWRFGYQREADSLGHWNCYARFNSDLIIRRGPWARDGADRQRPPATMAENVAAVALVEHDGYSPRSFSTRLLIPLVVRYTFRRTTRLP
jgi:hypothetical protein